MKYIDIYNESDLKEMLSKITIKECIEDYELEVIYSLISRYSFMKKEFVHLFRYIEKHAEQE